VAVLQQGPVGGGDFPVGHSDANQIHLHSLHVVQVVADDFLGIEFQAKYVTVPDGKRKKIVDAPEAHFLAVGIAENTVVIAADPLLERRHRPRCRGKDREKERRQAAHRHDPRDERAKPSGARMRTGTGEDRAAFRKRV